VKYFILIFLVFISASFPLSTPEGDFSVSLSKGANPEKVILNFHGELKEGWHLYYKDPGDSGAPPSFKFLEAAKSYIVSERTIWPPYAVKKFGDFSNNIYEKSVTIPHELTLRKGISVLAGEVNWVVCKEDCVPGKASFSFALDSSKEDFSFRDFIFVTLGAFLGGVLLNLMPCVFPILSIKALSIVEKCGKDDRAIRLGGVFYTLGVLVSFWIIAGILLLLRYGGSQVGWGFQLQSPLFISLMVLFTYGWGLNLLGLFEVGSRTQRLAGKLDLKLSGDKSLSAFISGSLATAIASPCSAPFMGSAIAYALTTSTPLALVLFTSLALGMASPFLLISFVPGSKNILPRPGEWMESFKKVLSLPLFGTAIWLLDILGTQRGSDAIIRSLIGILLLSIALSLYGSQKRTLVTKVLMVIAFLGALYFTFLNFTTTEEEVKKIKGGAALETTKWREFSPVLLDSLRASGRRVFIDFTAAWCVTCQVNKKVVLETTAVIELFKKYDVELLRADWSNQDEVIGEFLNSLGRNSVPVYALYLPGKDKPHIFSTLLTKAAIQLELSK
jgi:thiol:disulfide interchange protein DsbD